MPSLRCRYSYVLLLLLLSLLPAIGVAQATCTDCYDGAFALYRGGEFEAALQVFDRSCDKKDPRSCRMVGNIHNLGFAGPKDTKKAAAYFKTGCDLGDGAACWSIAKALSQTPDREATAQAALRACTNGSSAGCALAGKTFGQLEPSRADARKLRKALAKGQVAAERLCAKGDTFECEYVAEIAKARKPGSRSSSTGAEAKLSDKQIKKLLIKESIGAYDGKCPCPYNTMSNGRRCGRLSAYEKPGGEAPLCFARDVTSEMVNDYRREHIQ